MPPPDKPPGSKEDSQEEMELQSKLVKIDESLDRILKLLKDERAGTDAQDDKDADQGNKGTRAKP